MIRIALVGNPNSGKTTLFNALTGSNQFVGNWPGVTVEKKEGTYRSDKNVGITDLPGIYSLSPYTLEEVVARNYLINENPDAVLNIVDGTNLERNLYLTTQLAELGLPMVVAVNMMDVVAKQGDKIDTKRLAAELGCPVVEISALKGTGIEKAVAEAVQAVKKKVKMVSPHSFSGCVEHAIAHIEEAVLHDMPDEKQRWYAVKLFERDKKVQEALKIDKSVLEHIESDIKACEKELDDDAESIITNERYTYIASIIGGCYKKKNVGKLSTTDKIDRVVTNRWLALPIFALVMWLVYYVAMVTIGTAATDWTNDNLFGDGYHLFGIGGSAYEAAAEEYGDTAEILGAAEAGEKTYVTIDDETMEVSDPIEITDDMVAEAKAMEEKYGEEGPDPADYGVWVPGIPALIEKGLDAVECADWLKGLVLDGIVAGVGAVLGFVPQMLVLFLFLAFLESCGYMARIAFILDRIFRRFGLSGKSFIPMLVGVGCGVPGIMACRTIESERDRRMTIMTTTFIPCGAKVPFIALVSGAIFGGSAWVATSAYFIGIGAIICSGIILKKTKMFSGDPAPFVMELPAYHWPTVGNVLRSMWERGWSFIKKAGTIILLSTIFVWFFSFFGWTEGGFGMLEEDQLDSSILAKLGSAIAWIFAPLGWGNWQATVASITGLVAKENIVGTMGILYGGEETWTNMSQAFNHLSGMSFLIFNLLCAPCFAAMGAIKREMNSGKWTAFAITYQCVAAYIVGLIVYQLGMAFTGSFGIGTVFGAAALVFVVYMLFRKDKYRI
ncbi:MAG: ferrous iron transporter B [Spirochaetia bacterium]|nr:ferrous iron transporter B [Spirochaetia bacterium]